MRDMDIALKQLPVPTRDWNANASTVLEALREVGQLDLEDFFTFLFGDAVQDLDAAPYGGARFPVDARLAGRSFVKFYLDVSTGDVLRGSLEMPLQEVAAPPAAALALAGGQVLPGRKCAIFPQFFFEGAKTYSPPRR